MVFIWLSVGLLYLNQASNTVDKQVTSESTKSHWKTKQKNSKPTVWFTPQSFLVQFSLTALVMEMLFYGAFWSVWREFNKNSKELSGRKSYILSQNIFFRTIFDAIYDLRWKNLTHQNMTLLRLSYTCNFCSMCFIRVETNTNLSSISL